jgi:predicted RecB family endonuclease
MSWQDFERCIKEVFRIGGWDVFGTDYYDAGSDVIATLDGIEYAIQVKHRKDPEARIDVDAVEQAARGRDRYGSMRALLVTNALVTAAAETRAAELAVQVWDRWGLAERLRDLGLVAIDADTRMACPDCGLPMVVADGRSRAAWVCDQRAGGCGTRLSYCAPALRLV